MIAFGPVPSRRLGSSLGINNIPPKICTYSCVYCQLGKTLKMQINRDAFYNPYNILNEVEQKINDSIERGEQIDFLTFVPDGEPTLDVNLGKEIEIISGFNIKIVVISSSSLIWRDDVKDDLRKAHWVSLKIDTATENIWKIINRPIGTLNYDNILQGILDFSNTFNGELATETMLIQNINDSIEELKKVTDFIAKINPRKSYISIPIRPPAEGWAKSATEHSINTAYQIFKDKSIDTEYLICYEGDNFAFTGNVEEDLLSITLVHPMRKDSVAKFLKKANADWDIIIKLINEDKLKEVKYKNKEFYIRRLDIIDS